MASFSKFNAFLKNQMNGVAPVDFDTHTIKVALAASAYAPNGAADDFFNDLTNEVSGGNYSAGGATLANKTLAEAAGTVTFDADDVTFAQHASGFANARILALYMSTGTPSTSPLIVYSNLGADKGNVGGDLIFQWHASGLLAWA